MKLSIFGIALFIIFSTQIAQARHACFLWFNCSHSDCRTDGCRSGQICSNKPGPVSKDDPYTCRDENSPTYRSPQIIKRMICSEENCAGICIAGACMMRGEQLTRPTTFTTESKPKGILPCIPEKKSETTRGNMMNVCVGEAYIDELGRTLHKCDKIQTNPL